VCSKAVILTKTFNKKLHLESELSIYTDDRSDWNFFFLSFSLVMSFCFVQVI